MRALTTIAFTVLSAPVLAAPTPLGPGDDGWRFAACNLEAICQRDGRCAELQLPGQTYLWRDDESIRIGTRADEANEIAFFRTELEAATEISQGFELPSDSFMVIGADGQGPGWLRMALYRLRSDGESLAPRFSILLCETRPEAPSE